MQQKNTRRGFTQIIVRGNLLFTSPLEGEDVQRTDEGVLKRKALFYTPSPRCWRTRPLPPGARETAHGFTLIELLVVVLIIGILVAVALPQYTKAVRKARIAEAKVILKQLTDAQDVWYLTTDDTFNPDWEKLDVEIPTETKNWRFYTDECTSSNEPGSNGLTGCNNRAIPKWESGYEIGYASSNYESGVYDFSGHFFCMTDETICTGLGGVESEDWEAIYILP